MTNHRRTRVSVLGWIVASALLTMAATTNAADAVPLPSAAKQELKPVARLSDFPDWVTSLAWSSDGRVLAGGSYETIRFWNFDTKKSEPAIDIKAGYIKGLAYSPDGKLLVAGGYQAVTLWDVASRSIKQRLEGHSGQVTGVAFSPDGQWIVSSSEDETVRLWKVADGTPGVVLRGHQYPVNGVAISADGTLIASAAGDDTRVTRRGEVKLWETATGKELAGFDQPAKAATAVAFSPNGKLLASTGFDEKVILYDVGERKPLGKFDAHNRPTNCVAFSQDNRTVFSGSGGRAQGGDEVKIWDCVTGEEKATIAGHEGRVSALALSPDGKTLATGSYDKSMALWDVGSILSSSREKPPVKGADGATVASAETQKEKSEAIGKKAAGNSPVRVGIIGLDTSHAIAFTQALNDPNAAKEIAGFRVVAAYPKGSPDIESSTTRVPMYTETVQKNGVEIVDSIDALLDKVDVVLLETNDGRPHLEQALQVMKRGKRVFIDKPVAGSLADAVAIYEAAKRYHVPVFSSSSLRYGKNTQDARSGKVGNILQAETYSPCSLEKTHPDLYWYGIHGVESLFTVMGTGCVSVRRTVSTADEDVVVGTWKNGRSGTFHGYRKGKGGYGGTAEGTKGKMDIGESSGYGPLIVEIARFFRTGEPPVSEEETLEIYAFMEAADESKRQKGAEVTLESVLTKARAEAAKKLAE